MSDPASDHHPCHLRCLDHTGREASPGKVPGGEQPWPGVGQDRGGDGAPEASRPGGEQVGAGEWRMVVGGHDGLTGMGHGHHPPTLGVDMGLLPFTCPGSLMERMDGFVCCCAVDLAYYGEEGSHRPREEAGAQVRVLISSRFCTTPYDMLSVHAFGFIKSQTDKFWYS